MRAAYRTARAGSRWLCVAVVALVPAGTAGAGEAVVPYTVTDAARIEHSLIGRPGDPAAGARLYGDAESTGCALCHATPGQGAPALVAGRIPAEAGVLRLWLVAPEVRDPALAFHAYYRAGQRTGAHDPRHGGPRLTAADG